MYETNGRQTNKNRIPNFSILADTCNTWRRDFFGAYPMVFRILFYVLYLRTSTAAHKSCFSSNVNKFVKIMWTGIHRVYHSGIQSHTCRTYLLKYVCNVRLYIDFQPIFRMCKHTSNILNTVRVVRSMFNQRYSMVYNSM